MGSSGIVQPPPLLDEYSCLGQCVEDLSVQELVSHRVGTQVTHIGDDFVVFLWEDELEVQQVQMYELIKP